MERIEIRPKTAERNFEHSTFHIFLLALLSLSMATFLLFHFTCIWLYGRLYISEPKQWLLMLETGLIVSVLAFSAYCLIEQMKGIK